MKYCTKCGAELLDDAVQCPQCGTSFSNGFSKEQANDTLGQIAFIFMIIVTILTGFLIIPLFWTIPMTIHCSNCVKNNEQASIPFGVCTLLFVSKVAGILLLVRTLNK